MRRFNLASAAAWVGLALLTAGYCWVIWIGTGLFSAILGFETVESVPMLTRVLAGPLFGVPYHVLHWQLLAVLSLIAGISWGFRRAGTMPPEVAHAWPAGICLTTLLVLGCWQMAVLLSPFVATAYVIE